jgi:DMSO/TMAO reductase YedYZ molybdopterin-dependent catalytic subunit
MALFLVKHAYAPEQCPSQDASDGTMLLDHMNRPDVVQFGVKIHGEARVRGEHTLYLIAEAEDESRLGEFLTTFAGAGSVEIYPVATCSGVVAAGSCNATRPGGERVPMSDPTEVCQEPIEAGLVVRRAHPLNCETSIQALLGGVVMPNARFYVRNHFDIPRLNIQQYRLAIGGLVQRPLSLSLRELRALRSLSRVVTLECAGNGRALFEPATAGEKWELGAVSTAEWTGVALPELLKQVGVLPDAREVLFRGADGGMVEERPAPIRFERSLRLDDPHLADALLAYAMNGEPLSPEHGYPLRLVVPGWYAVTSVKWLTEIELIERPFGGFFQADRYWYLWDRAGQVVTEPVTLQRVRALITEPSPNQEVPLGEIAIRGVVWSGAAPVARVEVSVGEGGWQEARLLGELQRGSWRRWELLTLLDRTGIVGLRARATDEAGHKQPERAEWNRLGYGNNSIQSILIRVQ